mmetsp:Transcript_13604/g.26652  ORF Transcript_13604/g.26652 Transcript_13604/m.26652 type:complete len:148 (-) Transcript_13604:1104-1547(-)
MHVMLRNLTAEPKSPKSIRLTTHPIRTCPRLVPRLHLEPIDSQQDADANPSRQLQAVSKCTYLFLNPALYRMSLMMKLAHLTLKLLRSTNASTCHFAFACDRVVAQIQSYNPIQALLLAQKLVHEVLGDQGSSEGRSERPDGVCGDL